MVTHSSSYTHCSSYQVMVQWVDDASKAQGEVEPIKSELDAVQNQLEAHKVTYYSIRAVTMTDIVDNT